MTYPSTGIAAKAIGVKTPSHIGECCRGKIKSYKGFIWRYVEDIVSPSGESQRDISNISQDSGIQMVRNNRRCFL